MNIQKIMDNLIFNYYVFFEKKGTKYENTPLIFKNKFYSSNQMHLWDEELTPIINVFWYILQLPRVALDLFENSCCDYLYCHDSPHNIKTLPFFSDNSLRQNNINAYITNPTLIICPDNISEYVKNIPQAKLSKLGICKISELNTQLLNQHWNRLTTLIIDNNYAIFSQLKRLFNEHQLLDMNNKDVIQIYQLANQLNCIEAFLNKSQEELIKNVVKKHTDIMYCCQEFFKKNNNALEKYKAFPIKKIEPKFPVIISLPGTPDIQINKYGRNTRLSHSERNVLKLISLHRCAAKNGIFIDISQNDIIAYMFNELLQLEEHCRISKRTNNKFVWRTLRRIGRLLSNLLRNKGINIIENVSNITVFSDFPIGIAILPETNVPLCCIKPISCRPLTPLTRTFQLEISKKPIIYIGNDTKLKILFAECVDKNDIIRNKCNSFSEILIHSFSDSNFEFIYKEITSVNELKTFIKANIEAKILIISAHGFYDTANSNMSGLIIGKDDHWLGLDNDINMPPIVILSACHTSPRGRGAFVVGDMMLRAGAIAVLTTLIPVNVMRNATLLVRLFTYIREAQKKFNNLNSLDQIWQHVIATNALHEIIAGSKNIEIWANTKDKEGKTPQERFKMERSVGKLDFNNIYNDTEKILIQMAKEDGIGEKMENYLKSQGYFPESIFYQWLGSPENIFVYNPHYIKAMKEFETYNQSPSHS